MIRIITRCRSVRLLVLVSNVTKTVKIEVDDEDISRATEPDIEHVWSTVLCWAQAWRSDFPGWKVNGIDNTPPELRELRYEEPMPNEIPPHVK